MNSMAFPDKLDANMVRGFAATIGGSTHPHLGVINGRQYVLKCGSYSTNSSDEHVHNEFVADEFLRAAGCMVPASREYQADIGHGKVETIRLSEFIVSKIGDGLKYAYNHGNAAQKQKLLQQIIDTYPVIAFIDMTDSYQHYHLDNVLVDKDYNLWFIDNGASFDFRARGLRKHWFWDRNSVFDKSHGYFSVRDDANHSFKNIVASVTDEQLRNAARKYDFADLVKTLPMDYQRKELLEYAQSLNDWFAIGSKNNNNKIEVKKDSIMTKIDIEWLEEVSLQIAKAVRRINKFIDSKKPSETSKSRTMDNYRKAVDISRMQKLALEDASSRVDKLLNICDDIANSEASGFTVPVLGGRWQPNAPSTQRPGRMGNVDFADYAFTEAGFLAAGGKIESEVKTMSDNVDGNGGISVVLGDITMQKCDAIVNAANREMLGGGGVDGAIHRAAGNALYQECLAVKEVRPGVRCPTGEARITGAGKLPCKFVVHTVGPRYRDGRHGEPDALANCYRNSLMLAYDNGVRDIVFPSISTGAYGYPAEDAAPIAIREAREFLKTHADMKITFCVFNGPRDPVDMKALYDGLLTGKRV